MNPPVNFEVFLELFWAVLGDILGHLGPGNGAVNPLLFYTLWGHLGALLGLSWGRCSVNFDVSFVYLSLGMVCQGIQLPGWKPFKKGTVSLHEFGHG